MAQQRRLVIATTNPHKVDEFRQLLAEAPYTLTSLSELGISQDVPETGDTFAENAVIKARAYAELSGLLTLADDSGLEIDALEGAPGVLSARWAGSEVPYETRNRMLVERLAGLPDERRGARYRCSIAIALPPPRGLVGVVDGILEGRIAYEPAGHGGFGYDPIFFVPEQGRTVGQMTPEEKHAISHRALAARAALPLLERLANDESTPH
ncbi:MAG TPA: RdgB/HAM1 family non-canonical purine NTP pyrophosphatase [Ktedonobacterales bacterium]|nr:RdgB/HAM1 family non-canonical purine NTP pyrophosphatase [Ktedonobacterales bacterium]